MNRCLMRRRRRVTSSKGIRRDVSVDSARYPGRLLRAAARLDHPRCMSTEDPKVVTLFDPKSVLTVYIFPLATFGPSGACCNKGPSC